MKHTVSQDALVSAQNNVTAALAGNFMFMLAIYMLSVFGVIYFA